MDQVPRMPKGSAVIFTLCFWLVLVLIPRAWPRDLAAPIQWGIAGEPPLSKANSIDLLPTRQVIFQYDRDGDGRADYWVARSLVEMIPRGPACIDPDHRLMLVPRDGYYLVEKEGIILKTFRVPDSGMPAALEETP